MKKIPACIFQLYVIGFFLMMSCGKDDIFNEKNSFNLDTLYANPNTGITDNFQLIWEVSIEGFPQFLIDVYLSGDDILDQGDLRIAETADTEINTDPDQRYINGINFRMIPDPGNGIQFEFSHDQITWQDGSATDEVLDGKLKYLIARFYHPLGLLIETGRTRMAVEIEFE
ncbi:MAG: hypothetical protein KFF73_05990 [Cyclobacteriaceae bacterium]|nr:hypothetical protein [Cyclobacteriaceae bacterium]